MMVKTEEINPRTVNIGEMPAAEAVRVMQEENLRAVEAVGRAEKEIAETVTAAAERMARGGRLFYVGCGTSGRLGVLDASECPPTFGVSPETVVGLIAGGDRALRFAVEGVEDNAKAGKNDIAGQGVGPLDSVVGISASGGAAYVVGALREARKRGAFTASVSSNPGTKIEAEAEVAIVAETGAEVIAGSTRMKAGSAQKMILNMISTGVMIRLGYVYRNMMINLRPMNQKLRGRMIGIVTEITGVDAEASERLLERADWKIREAVELFRGKNGGKAVQSEQ